MRILHLNAAYWPFVGGAETYVKAMSELLVGEGHRVTVVTTDATNVQCFWDPRQPRVAEHTASINGVRVIRNPVGHLPFAPWSFYLLRRLAAESARLPLDTRFLIDRLAPCMPRVPGLEQVLDNLPSDFDLVHGINISLEWPLIAGWRYARRLGLPFVVTPLLHVGERVVQRFYTMPHQMAAIRDADCVFVLTGIEGRELEHLGVSGGRIVRLGAGIDMDRQKGGDGTRFRTQYGVEGPLVAFMGAVTDDKGVVHLVQAMQHLWNQGSDATLVIAGHPIQPSSFDRIYDELPGTHRSHIRRLGPVSEPVKQDMLAATDLFVMPSRVDSFGIVYLEAWAYGAPVIGCRAGGVPDVIDDGQDGLLVPFGDPGALALAIEKLLSDPDLRQAMGRRGRAKVREHYTWERIYEKLRVVYQTLAGSPSALAGEG